MEDRKINMFPLTGNKGIMELKSGYKFELADGKLIFTNLTVIKRKDLILPSQEFKFGKIELNFTLSGGKLILHFSNVE